MIPGTGLAQSRPMSTQRWQHQVEERQADRRLPSVVAGVLRDGELVWTGGAGQVPDGDPADVQYRIGSITKTMTAVLVLALRDAGELDLDDPIGRYLPETGYAAASVRDLLSHTSGMQSEPVGSWWERSPGTDFATLNAANDGTGAVAGAGEYYHYSNLGYALLGELVARLHQASWWEVVASRLLEPLGMSRTSYTEQAPFASGFSVGHFDGRLTREPHQDTGAMAPAGQLWSTLDDLAVWARLLLDGAPGVITTSSVREMAQPRLGGYGLGLRLLRHDGRGFVGHTGSMPGFMASLFVDPVDRDGVIALANGTTGLLPEAWPGAMLGTGTGERAPRPTQVAAWQPSTRIPAAAEERLGVWFWGNTAFAMRWHNDRLELRALTGDTLSGTFRAEEDTFVGESGYHRGERLRVTGRHDDGTPRSLECATFVYTRVPYDRGVEIPGGHPDPTPGTRTD